MLRSSEHLRTFSATFGCLWEIFFGSGCCIFGNRGHDDKNLVPLAGIQKASYRIIPRHFINTSLKQGLKVEVDPLLIKDEIIKLTTNNIMKIINNSPSLSPYFSYKSTVEKILQYQENSPWMIISLILMTSGVE